VMASGAPGKPGVRSHRSRPTSSRPTRNKRTRRRLRVALPRRAPREAGRGSRDGRSPRCRQSPADNPGESRVHSADSKKPEATPRVRPHSRQRVGRGPRTRRRPGRAVAYRCPAEERFAARESLECDHANAQRRRGPVDGKPAADRFTLDADGERVRLLWESARGRRL
jgi:hypothetical protein